MKIKKKLNFTTVQHSIKHPNYSSYRKQTYKKLKTICVGYNTQETNFTMSDFIRQSKKLRSNVIERVELDISIYILKALLVREKKGYLNTDCTYLLRNVFNSVPYEVNIVLQSPVIDFIARDYGNPRRFKRRNIRFLREKPLPYSKVVFPYIVGFIPLNMVIENKYEYITNKIAEKNLNYQGGRKYEKIPLLLSFTL
jgi:hypothetical protein